MKTLVTAMIATVLTVACGANKESGNSSNAAVGSSSSNSNSSSVGSSNSQSIGGTSATTTQDGKTIMYLAENVILDTTTKVSASQIMLTDSQGQKVGRLKSNNLEQALATAVAPSLADILKSKVWVANNKTSSSDFDGAGNGHVTFTDNEIILVDGRFAAGGMNDTNCNGVYIDPKYTYELVGNGHMILTSHWTQNNYGQSSSGTRDTILKISIEDENTLIVVGHGICGNGDDGVTVLNAVVSE